MHHSNTYSRGIARPGRIRSFLWEHRGWPARGLRYADFAAMGVPACDVGATQQTASHYFAHFRRAEALTRQAGFDVRPLRLLPRTLDRASPEHLERALIDTVGRLELSALGCMHWSANYLDEGQVAFRSRLQLTFGSISDDGHPIFSASRTDLLRWSTEGFNADEIASKITALRIHAWWTSEHGHIVDPTVCSSLALLGERPLSYIGAILAGFPGQGPFRYQPMFVGRGFIDSMAQHTGLKLV